MEPTRILRRTAAPLALAFAILTPQAETIGAVGTNRLGPELSAGEISRAFEVRHVSSDAAANGETDFKGETAVLSTEERVAYLRDLAEYGKDFFNDPGLDTKIVEDSEIQAALQTLKPQPLPEVRTEIPIRDWKYVAYRDGQREKEADQVADWHSMPGAVVKNGALELDNSAINRTIDRQAWRTHFEWKAKITAENMNAAFKLSNAVFFGFESDGTLYYITDGEKRQAGMYEPGVWRRFKVELDLESDGGGYNLFVDDEKVADFVPLSGHGSVDTFEAATDGKLWLDDIRIMSFGPEGNSGSRDKPFEINTVVNQDFEVVPDPQGFETADYDDSQWREVPYERYAHGSERHAGESLYLRKWVEVGDFDRAILDVETVRPSGVLYVNGQEIGALSRHPKRVDLTGVLLPNQENLIAVRVDPYILNTPAYHMSVDRHSSWFAGLMHLELTEAIFIEDVFAYATEVGNPATLRVQVKTDSLTDVAFNGEIVVEATPWYPEEAQAPAAIASTPVTINGETTGTVDVSIPDPKLWTTAEPNLYKVRVVIKDPAGNAMDDKIVTTGLRTVNQAGGTFRVNGEPSMLNGPLIFGHHDPLTRIAQWMFSPPQEKWIQDILMTRKMNGNALRISVHDQVNSGIQDRRLARIADQLGIMLIWQSPAWIREGGTGGFDFDGLVKYAKAVRNHPSIVIWQPGNHPPNFPPEWYGNVIASLAAVDPSRLISPAANLSSINLDELGGWPEDEGETFSGWAHPQHARGNMERPTGYGKEWDILRKLGTGYDGGSDMIDRVRVKYLNSDTHAWFDFESEETIAMPNWRLHRGQPYYHLYSYEKNYYEGSIGRVLTFDEYQESQAWQALAVIEPYRKKRWLGYDGTNWCPLHGGGNTATYRKPIVDYLGHAKLAYHAMRMIYQPVLAGSKNVDIVYGPDDSIPVMVLNMGDAKTVDVLVVAKNTQGSIIDRKHYTNVNLAAGRTVTDLPPWKPDLNEPGNYMFEYTVLVEMQVDEAPPTPNPSSFLIEPSAVESGSIGMVATSATDFSPPVEYQFENVTNSGSSDWSTHSEWTNTGLTDGVSYSYRVRTRDALGNTGDWSAEASATAGADTTAPAPDPISFASPPTALGETEITMTATNAFDINGVEYFFEAVSGPGNDSGWQDAAEYTDTALAPGSEVSYRVRARDKSAAQNTTAWSATATTTTEAPDLIAPTPDPMTFAGPFASPPAANGALSVTMTATTATDDSGVEYFFEAVSGGGNDSGWQGSPEYTDTGLDPETTYSYRVRARDKSPAQNTTAFSATFSATTAVAGTLVSSASDTFTGYIATGGQTITFSSFDNFSLGGADKLVVTFGMRHSGTPASPISSVTYAGQAMTEAVGTGDGVIYESSIWYLDNPGTTTGDLVVTMARGYGAAATIYALSGTEPGVGATGLSSGSSTSLTTTGNDSWVLAHSTVQGTLSVPLAQSPMTLGESPTVLYSSDPFNTNRNHSSGTGYQTVATAGSVSPTFDIGAQTVAAEFLASPSIGGDTFADWIAGKPGVNGQTAITDDPDGDGVENGVENFFGTEPGEFSQGLTADAMDSGTGAFTFTHPQGSLADDLTATYRWSKDLASFHDDGATDPDGTTVSFTPAFDTPSAGMTTVTASLGGTPSDRIFVVVEVTQN